MIGTRIRTREEKRILITGTEKGAGATHLALALANVAASKERLKTLYIEIGKNGNLAAMRTKETLAVEGTAGFRKSGVCYLPQAKADDVQRSAGGGRWDVIICDVTEPEAAEELFDLCGIRMILCDVKPWHYPTFQQSMNKLIRSRNKEKADFYSFTMLPSDRKRAETEFAVRIREVPYVGNPFRMTHKEAVLLAQLL